MTYNNPLMTDKTAHKIAFQELKSFANTLFNSDTSARQTQEKTIIRKKSASVLVVIIKYLFKVFTGWLSWIESIKGWHVKEFPHQMTKVTS